MKKYLREYDKPDLFPQAEQVVRHEGDPKKMTGTNPAARRAQVCQ